MGAGGGVFVRKCNGGNGQARGGSGRKGLALPGRSTVRCMVCGLGRTRLAFLRQLSQHRLHQLLLQATHRTKAHVRSNPRRWQSAGSAARQRLSASLPPPKLQEQRVSLPRE